MRKTRQKLKKTIQKIDNNPIYMIIYNKVFMIYTEVFYMKKMRIFSILICLIFICSNAYANTTPGIDTLKLQIGNPYMTFNGVQTEIDAGRGTVPVVENGRTLVPIRAIIEALGGTVGWDGETSTVTLTHKTDVIKLVIGSKTASFNGTQSELDVAPATINERTMLPIRYIAESFKFSVEWDGVTSTVTIIKNENMQNITDAEHISDGNDNFDVHDDPTQTEDEQAPGDDIYETDPEEEEMNPEDELSEEEFVE